jgi:hypothetical protein
VEGRRRHRRRVNDLALFIVAGRLLRLILLVRVVHPKLLNLIVIEL